MRQTLCTKTNLVNSVFLFMMLCVTSRIQAKIIFPVDEDYAIVVDKTPTPIGGIESIVHKMAYPEMAIKTRTEGKVYVMIYINESGSVDDVKIIKGIGAGCDEESVRVLKRIKFTPGEQKGVPVKTKFSLALSFKLPK